MEKSQLKTKIPDIEFYNVGKIKYCKIKFGSVNIDAPTDTALTILAGMGLFAIALSIFLYIALDGDTTPSPAPRSLNTTHL